jgi:DNA helicase-2/ATP-dependent DNA helicase PcrA
MYYDYELGEAKYDSPGGEVVGEVILKRQFKIWKGGKSEMSASFPNFVC